VSDISSDDDSDDEPLQKKKSSTPPTVTHSLVYMGKNMGHKANNYTCRIVYVEFI